MLSSRGWPNGAADSRTAEPTNHWSALSRRKAAPTSQCLACTNPLYPPKLGDKNRTGIQPCANESMGVAAAPQRITRAETRRRFILLLRFLRIIILLPEVRCRRP